ncbi:MAG: hypothetical protein JXA78_11350 [Anaerolineales bacterium]|nr:hypothetical protein [Anaerolineales bacterium]
MKASTKLALILAALLAGLSLAAAPLQGSRCGNLVLGGVCSLEEGDTLEGDMLVLGGSVFMEDGSRVDGGVVIMGGSLQSDGRVDSDIIVLGGQIELGETAEVYGDVVAIGGRVDRAEGARIEGEVFSNASGVFPFVVPGVVQIPDWEGGAPSIIVPGDVPHVDVRYNPFLELMWAFVKSFGWALLAILAVLLLPQNAERTAGAATAQPLASGGLGCATALVVPILLLALAITICGIPISLVGALLLLAGWVFGVIALGLEVGKRLARALKQDWALPVSAAAGAFLLTLVINGIDALVPCIGWIVPALVGAVGLGAVLLTRFGAQTYPLDMTPFPPQPPAPPPAAPLGELEEPAPEAPQPGQEDAG